MRHAPPVDRYFTPPDLARKYGVSVAKVLTWIRGGELVAVDLASAQCHRPRYAISPQALESFEAGRRVVPAATPARRRPAAGGNRYFAHVPD